MVDFKHDQLNELKRTRLERGDTNAVVQEHFNGFGILKPLSSQVWNHAEERLNCTCFLYSKSILRNIIGGSSR